MKEREFQFQKTTKCKTSISFCKLVDAVTNKRVNFQIENKNKNIIDITAPSVPTLSQMHCGQTNVDLQKKNHIYIRTLFVKTIKMYIPIYDQRHSAKFINNSII